MALLRKLLFPFSMIYGWITGIRNVFYDRGIFKSYGFDVPVIAIGNLSTGGTGKTPMTEYIVDLISKNYKTAILSRGYKRKSNGFILAGDCTDAELIGDEPYQYYLKFPTVDIAVDADRKNGIETLLRTKKPQVIVLDDAFQHRKVKAGLYILLTTFTDLYAEDMVLPAGNLRESKNGARRADIIVITKCPLNLSASDQNKIREKLSVNRSQELFFASVAYGPKVHSGENTTDVSEIISSSKLLVAGIAKPQPFFDYLKNEGDMVMNFPDHHHFSEKDIKDILEKAGRRPIITTEKDYVRLKDKISGTHLWYLPIKIVFLNSQSSFDNLIENFIREKSS